MSELTGFSWFYFLLGFSGIVLHQMFRVWKTGGRTLTDVWTYLKANNLSLVISVFAYVCLCALWQSEGIGFLGFEQGKLTGATLFAGFTATSMFQSAVAIRTQIKGEVPKLPEDGEGGLP